MPTIETGLKEILAKIGDRLDRIDERLSHLETGQARISEKLDNVENRVSRLEDSQNRQIWALIVAVIGALIAALVRFGFLSHP